MQENGTYRESSECAQFPEAVRLLWEGTQKGMDGGIDTKDLVSLCDIIVRLADHRLLLSQVYCDSHSAEAEEAAEQIRRYRKLASDVLVRVAKPAAEPDWAAIAESLVAVGAAPLEWESQAKERPCVR